MRRWLALVLVIAGAILLFLRCGSREEMPVGLPPPTVSVDRPRNEIAEEPVAREDERVVASPIATASPVAAVPREGGCTVTIVLEYADAADSRGAAYVSCSDERGRGLEEVKRDPHTFVVESVAPGPYRYTAFVPEHEHADGRFDVAAEDAEKRVEIVLRPLPNGGSRKLLVRWQCTDGSAFLPALAQRGLAVGGTLRLRNAAGGGNVLQVPTPKTAYASADGVGRFRPGAPRDSAAILVVTAVGETTVEAFLDGWKLASLRVEEHAEEVVIRTDIEALSAALGSIRGCVVAAADRVPFAEFRAEIEVDDVTVRRVANESEAGCFRVEGLPPGPIRLRLTAGGASIVREIQVEPGRRHDLGQIAMPGGCAFGLRFVDEVGAPIEGARFGVAARDELERKWPLQPKFSKSKFGAARVDAAADGELVVVVEAPGRGLSTITIPPCGRRSSEFDVRLTSGVVVTLDLGLGDRTSTVRVATAAGDPLGEYPTTATALATVELSPGSYRAWRTGSSTPTDFVVTAEPIVVVLK